MFLISSSFFFFFFNDTATTEIYTLSLHDALPIYAPPALSTRSETTWVPSWIWPRPRACCSSGARAPARISPPCAEARKRSRSEEHTSELQSQSNLVCRLLLEKKK